MNCNDLVGAFNRHGEVFRKLGDKEPSTRVEAQAVIENIRAEKGYLDEETLQELSTLRQQSQDRLHRIIELKRQTEAAYTKNVSEELYISKHRFLYELVQNADDSSYRMCSVSKSDPYLRFELTPNTFIIETNEDGFKRANIEAICATGRSSKKALETDDHIGEKGYGFKSVFSVAEEVEIQSGLWSFSFKHRQGEDGLGMVTPLDALPETLPNGVTTRITLRYSDDAKSKYARLVEAVKELPDSLILFLQRLQAIKIKITTEDGTQEAITFTKQYDDNRTKCTVHRLLEDAKGTDEDTCVYLLFSTTKNDMPYHERRKNRKAAKIELAFPVDPDRLQPKLLEQGQHVFAYLPLQRLPQIQFLIQSDFVALASREDVIDCSWNDALSDGVAQAFVSAVSNIFLRKDHSLFYSWLDYLPGETMKYPWKSLRSSIVKSLSTKPVLQTRTLRQLRPPIELRIVVTGVLWRNEPILPDILSDEIYLAPSMRPNDTQNAFKSLAHK
ncbi:hypothetical protein GQ44DRAFT_777898 [Phaeosphaeriaceae sp. PMI808]|nr:hypothetical protein GQ44DRAFT_777898 [Phaeosphaeriaceae sp. PMI808]